MIGLVESTASAEFLLSLAGAAAKASLVLAAVLMADLALRRQSAALRHRLWTAAFVALLVLPLAAPLVPTWNVPLLPSGFAVVAPAEPATDSAARSTELPTGTEDGSVGPAADDVPPRDGRREGASGSRAAGLGWLEIGLAFWLVGAALLALRLAYGAWRATTLCRTCAEVDDPAWQRTLRRARRRLGVEVPVRLVRSDRVKMPMAWGLLRHHVVLPESADRWSDERREVVLLHELAHVRRGDCLAHLVSGLVAALYWLNPLVWIARRRQTAERELACDDTVLASGAEGADYAWHLLEIARGSGNRLSLAQAGVMMARKSQLEGRLLAVLDGNRDRSNVSRLGSALLTAASVLAVVALAGLQPWAVPTVEAAEPAPVVEVQRELGTETESSGEIASEREAPLPSGTETGLSADELAAQDAPTRERIVEMMERLLADPDASVRNQAVQSLGHMEDPRAVGPLSEVVRSDESASVRAQAAWALGLIESPDALPALTEAIADASASVRSQAAWAFGLIESPDGVPALIPALSDPERQVRNQAAWALGMIESPEAVAALVTALRQDDDAGVRRQAAWALGMIEDEGGLEALIDAVESDTDGVREQALWAIGMIVG